MRPSHLSTALALATTLAGCANVLGIDGSYGDQTSDGPAGSDDGGDDSASSTSTADGGPGAASADASTDTASQESSRPDGPDTGHDAGTHDAGGQPHDDGGDKTDASDGSAGPPPAVTASNRAIAFGPGIDGSGAASVYALRSDGTVMTWTFGASMTAQAAAGLPAAATIAGGTHVCLVSASDASLWCWGPGSPSPAGSKPTQLPGTGTGQWTMRGVTNGTTFTCALDDKGTVGCGGTLAGWTSPGGALSYPVFSGGMFASGQLFAASDVSAAGGAICVVNDSPQSGLFCWGDNADLVAAPTGMASQTQAYPWVVLTSPQDPVTVSVSPSHACSVYEQGGAGASRTVCWGAVPESSGTAESWDPVSIKGAAGVVTTGVPGTEATFLVMPDGTVTAAGTWPAAANAGLLGATYPAGSTSFVSIPALSGVRQMAALGTEACALLDDGAVECWGSTGAMGASPVAPTRVSGLP